MIKNYHLQFSQSIRYLPIILLFILLCSCSTGNTPVYQLNITSNPPEGGSVNPTIGEYDEGSEVTINAVPNGNWMFVQWQGDHSGSQNPDTVTVNSDMAITAQFQIAELSDDQFTGTYLFTQLEPSTSVAGQLADGWLFDESQEFIVELMPNLAGSPNVRAFIASPLPEFGEFETVFPILFNIEEKSVTLENEVSIELYCEDESILHGPASSPNASSFDLTDDSQFTLVIRENSNSQCGIDPEDITFIATKVGSITVKPLNITNQSKYNDGKKNDERRTLPYID